MNRTASVKSSAWVPTRSWRNRYSPNSINVASAARPASWKWCAITPRFKYAAKSWSHPRRVVARIEVTRKGADVRYVITNLTKGTGAMASTTISTVPEVRLKI